MSEYTPFMAFMHGATIFTIVGFLGGLFASIPIAYNRRFSSSVWVTVPAEFEPKVAQMFKVWNNSFTFVQHEDKWTDKKGNTHKLEPCVYMSFQLLEWYKQNERDNKHAGDYLYGVLRYLKENAVPIINSGIH